MKTWALWLYLAFCLALWVFDVKLDHVFVMGAFLFWVLYTIAQAMDRQHTEQMNKLAELELYLRSIENRLP